MSFDILWHEIYQEFLEETGDVEQAEHLTDRWFEYNYIWPEDY